jgi:tRNA G18 (ribose-2'-O)-methylase SpoU
MFVDLGISLYLADSNAEQSHYQLDLREPLAVIVSSEAHGPSTFVKQLDAHRFKIPMHNAMESLNVAVAGSVFLYEVLRQREEKVESPTLFATPKRWRAK